VPSIQFDRQAAAYQATQHLLTGNRTAIAYIGPEDRRVSGFQQALWARGIRADERLMTYAIDSFSGHACCEQLIASGAPMDAICAGTDEVAIGVLKSLHQHGLAVPGQIAVASIDNLDISAYTIPALTTVDVPRRQIGLHTIDTLAADKPAGRPATYVITVPTQLVIRESS
jgi:DNA-binding LacI/PurR family transcriptional regulator